MLLFKNTNSTIIHSILTTYLVLALVSCRSTSPPVSTKPEPEKLTKEATTVISTARSYLGTRYKMGGTTKKGMDCSGLTLTAFKSVNISLPRTAGDQSKMGKTVSLTELKPGDLVFLTDRKGSKKVTHVGIVTEVNGNKEIKFIHASTRSGVVEENLYAEWYRPLFIKGSRFF